MKTIVSANNPFTERVDLSAVERLIFTELPEAMSDNAPPNFTQLYYDLTQEYERFKSFVFYDKLVGRNVVALGGAFSSGKSTFLNTILNKRLLPVNIRPSASVPTYLVYGDHISVQGINLFKNGVSMDLEQVSDISHGFGKLDEDDSEATLGQVLESILITSPYQSFKNLAILDTPGYSTAESPDYSNKSVKTDEKIARAQLNSANYILWFVQANERTLTEDDIAFLSTLNDNIPRLIIVNKADRVMPEELTAVVKKVKDVLRANDISYIDVLTFSRKRDFEDDREKIISTLSQWDNEAYESRFAYNFMELFTYCREYYDDRIDEEEEKLVRLNNALALAIDHTVSDCLNSMVSGIKSEINALKDCIDNLNTLQNAFFSEMRRIGNAVNIEMPDPSEIDIIRKKVPAPKTIPDRHPEKHSAKRENDLQSMLAERFANIRPVFNSLDEDEVVNDELLNVISHRLNIPSDNVKFNKIHNND